MAAETLAPTFASLVMLAERLELHAPQCAGASAHCTCHPILDLGAFVKAVIDAHMSAGAKRRDGTLTGAPWLSWHDEEDLHQYLLCEAWAARQLFNGEGRLNGFVLQRLHFRTTDWIRVRFGATRYGTKRELVPFDGAIAAGIGLFERSRLMGTSVEQIDRTYGHLLPDSLDRARQALDSFGVTAQSNAEEGER